MAVKPVKVLTDLLTKKQIIKQDLDGNILFRISGSLNNGIVSSSLPVFANSGSFVSLNTVTTTVFDNISVITGSDNGLYNVNQAFHAVDIELNNIKSLINNEDTQSATAYKCLRYKEVGYFNEEGAAIITLPKTQYGHPSFPINSIDFLNVSVMVRDGDAWTNDLLSINIISGGINGDQIQVLLDAPALTNTDQYRLLAVNENPDDYFA